MPRNREDIVGEILTMINRNHSGLASEEAKSLIDKLDGFEFKIRSYSWCAVRNGVKFLFYAYSSLQVSTILAKTKKGGWSWKADLGNDNEIKKLHAMRGITDNAVDEAARLMKVIADAYEIPEQIARLKPVKDRKSMPEPLKFSDTDDEIVAYGEGRDSRWIDSVIETCFVSKVVSVKANAKANASDISSPGEEPWFLLECTNKLTATFNIISDGEVFHPVDRYNDNKITRKLRPKKSVDLGKMAVRDKAKVRKAIEEFIQEEL